MLLCPWLGHKGYVLTTGRVETPSVGTCEAQGGRTPWCTVATEERSLRAGEELLAAGVGG